MKRPRLRAPFPLLRKELVEQAARRRTYVVRVLYAVLLASLFALSYYDITGGAGGDLLQVLGRGDDVFEMLVLLQFVGIYAFLPGMMAGALSGEKERDSLGLLLVTDLRPWEIVLEKLGGRLVPMFTFLLLGLPLLAIAYSLGGITADYLLSGAYLLALTCLQVGAFALMLSAFCRTTAQAFIGCYVLGILFYFALPIVYVLCEEFAHVSVNWDEDVLLATFPIYVFFEYGDSGFGQTLLASIPVAVSAAVFLVLARVFVIRRAFLRGRGLVISVFHGLDVFFHRANRLVGGIVLVKDKDTLPGEAPVLWREVNKRTLGKVAHLVRIVCILGIPIVLVAGASLLSGFRRGGDAAFLTVMVVFLWIIAALAVAVSSATSVASERVHQTLEVLLATPMTGREIVLQKARGRWRLACVLGGLTMAVVFMEAWAEAKSVASEYVIASLLSVMIYLPMFTWVSLWIGLKVRTPSRAVITTTVVLVLWCAGPVVVLAMIEGITRYDPTAPPWSAGFLLSPASIIGFAESGEEWDWFGSPIYPIIANFLWHGAIWGVFRTLCLARADTYLGRVPESRRQRPTARVASASQEA